LLFEHLNIKNQRENLTSWRSRNDATHGNIIINYYINRILKDSDDPQEIFHSLLDGIISKE